MFHAKSSKNCNIIYFQTVTNAGIFVVDFDTEGLVYPSTIHNVLFLSELCINFNCSFGGSLSV